MKTIETEIANMLEYGQLTLPSFYKELITKTYNKDVTEVARKMFEAAWYNYLLNKGTISLPYYAKMMNHPKAMHRILKRLSNDGWLVCTTIPSRNWSEAQLNEDKLLEYVPMKQLEQIRAYYKYNKYMLKQDLPTKDATTRLNGKVRYTGITRRGFYKTGNVQFQFDTEAIKDYYDIIVAEVNKGMSKVRDFFPEMRRDTASYDEVSKSIVDSIILHEGTYSSGQFHSDSRGRNISGMLDKVFNPIGFKVARACLIIPEDKRQLATDKGLRNKYLFIAELNGFKKGKVEEKVNFGRKCYLNYTLPVTDTNKHRKEFYENIWLARTYDEIDCYFQISEKRVEGTVNRFALTNPKADFKWYVPIEIDMSASVLGYVGLLTNHQPFMERCNMLSDDLTDAWEIKGIPKRNQAKVIMRTIYGSSATCTEMWDDEEITYTPEDIKAYNDALAHGEIAVGDRFSKFIINNCNPTEQMKLHIKDEIIDVECNRYRMIGEKTIAYDLFNTSTKQSERIYHTETRKEADLDQFRRFMVTGLIHNLDSQVINVTADAVVTLYKWALDIHDALILDAESADFARNVYASELEYIHKDRKVILANYFKSIGIPKSALEKWSDVEKTVVPFKGEFKCNPMVLK